MSGQRLTAAQRADRALSEAEFRGLVDELARMLGWQWMTVGPLRTQHGWRTPTRGPLGAGWPDSIYVQAYRGRTLFAEFKRELGKTSPEQDHVHRILRAAGLLVHVWRPSDLTEGRIQEALS